MITEPTKQLIRDKLSAISAAMPGFRSRPAQRLMIAEIAKTFARCPDPSPNGGTPVAGSTLLVVQGGTGTGKSLGYGLSGILMAKAKGKRLVIASSTIALQDQLVKRDLPFFITAAGLEASVELAKGRTRYACTYKLASVINDMQQSRIFEREERAADAAEGEAIRKDIEAMAEDLAAGRWNGDRDTRAPIKDEVWKQLTTDRHGCLNRVCPSFKTCPQMAARQRVKNASVVVANHDLVLADLAMGGGKILPNPADCFYIFDEADNLPDKAVSAFASSHLVVAERRSAEKLANLAPALVATLGAVWEAGAMRLADDADKLRADLADAQNFFGSLTQLKPTRDCPRPTLEFQDSCLPEGFFEIGENVKSLTKSLLDQLALVQEALGQLLGTDRSKQALIEKLLSDVGFYVGRIEEVNQTWSLFLEVPNENAAPVAKWIETMTVGKSVDYRLNASPVVAGSYLKQLLWERAAGAVLTSATLATLGNFNDFLRRTGLKDYNVPCIDLPSPFDYKTQGILEIPKMPSPKNYDAHTSSLTARLQSELSALTAEGALVLFSSRKQMEDVVKALTPELAAKVLVQGVQSKADILSEHCARIDRGESSTIFGLDSFTTGIDLPGNYCNLVVVPKLPFAVPDNPVLRTLSDWIERRGGNPFMLISVPAAARKLEQSIGRLIRTETDKGRVLICDPRLWESRYGRSILRGLPPFQVVAMGKAVTV